MEGCYKKSWAGLGGAAVLAVVLFAVGCGQGATQAEPDDGRLRIVTTTAMVRDIVAQVAGEHAEVTGLMGETDDPHLYQPTRTDMLTLLEADAVFYSGLSLEGRMTAVFEAVEQRGKPVFAVTEEIAPAYLVHPPEFEGHPDPHVWMDAEAWSQAVAAVARRLAEIDPAHARAYTDNADRYRAQLNELDAYVQQVIASIPAQQRVLVTAHDAFNYFGRAYGIDVRGIQGISTQSEAGLDDINVLKDFIVSRGVPAVFVETSVSEDNVRALIRGAQEDRGHEVRIGGSLFSDAMGPAGTYEGTYIGMIDHNATVIARALGGAAPPGGMQGKLTR